MKRKPDIDALLSRDDFKTLVLESSKGKCVFCSEPATAAHHIVDRKLFPDGGYRLRNGAAVCDECHWKCETTEKTVEDVLKACHIDAPLLPTGFDNEKVYDKWGNEILADGGRLAGPLYEDDGMKKALKSKGLFWKIRTSP